MSIRQGFSVHFHLISVNERMLTLGCRNLVRAEKGLINAHLEAPQILISKQREGNYETGRCYGFIRFIHLEILFPPLFYSILAGEVIVEKTTHCLIRLRKRDIESNSIRDMLVY